MDRYRQVRRSEEDGSDAAFDVDDLLEDDISDLCNTGCRCDPDNVGPVTHPNDMPTPAPALGLPAGAG
eukprot:10621962-Prorocentrum_lima.AAC.1